MIKAVLLDFGGVVFKNKTKYLGPKGSLNVDPNLWHQARLGQIEDEVVFKDIAENYSVDTETVKQWLISKREPNEKLIELADQIRPNIKVGIVNNGLKYLFHTLLDKYALKDKFDVLVNSAEEQVEKPDPKIYLRAAQRLGVDPKDCLFVDDDMENLKGAEKVGMQTLFLDNVDFLKQKLAKVR